MSRSYHLDVARHVVGVDGRWVDNLLARFDIPGVESVGQGSSRRISNLGIYHVALVSRLVQWLGMPLEAASSLAVRLLATHVAEPAVAFGEVKIHFDRPAFVESIDGRITEAVEAIIPPQRGRPRRRI